MKKLCFLVLIGLFFCGCGTARKSEFLEHGSMYRNWDHLKFSWYGHNNPTEETGKRSEEQRWWGIEIPYIPAE